MGRGAHRERVAADDLADRTGDGSPRCREDGTGATVSRDGLAHPFCGQPRRGPWRGRRAAVDECPSGVDSPAPPVDRAGRSAADGRRPAITTSCDPIVHRTTTCCGFGLDRPSPPAYSSPVAPSPDDPGSTGGCGSGTPPGHPEVEWRRNGPTDGPAATSPHPRDRGLTSRRSRRPLIATRPGTRGATRGHECPSGPKAARTRSRGARERRRNGNGAGPRGSPGHG